MTLQAQVIAFHRLFNQDIALSPSVPDKKTIDLRVRLIAEEAFEIFESLYGSQPEWEMCQSMIANVLLTKEPRVDVAKFADGCGDLDWAVESTRLTFGIDGGPVAEAIFRANMKTVDGKRLETRGLHGRPTQWEPPDIESVLSNQTIVGDL